MNYQSTFSQTSGRIHGAAKTWYVSGVRSDLHKYAKFFSDTVATPVATYRSQGEYLNAYSLYVVSAYLPYYAQTTYRTKSTAYLFIYIVDRTDLKSLFVFSNMYRNYTLRLVTDTHLPYSGSYGQELSEYLLRRTNRWVRCR